MITVLKAPPFVTVQDLGRTGYRHVGVPPSGIADRDSGIYLNSLLGNEPGCAMFEWAVAGGTLKFETDAVVAVGGANAVCTVRGQRIAPWNAIDLAAGVELIVERIVHGRFLLIAVRGGIDVARVLGSRSTLVSAGIGGHHGRRLLTGDRLPVGNELVDSVSVGAPPVFEVDLPIPIMRGPQAELFGRDAWATLLGARFLVSRASDRSGYRLDGEPMNHGGSAALPSEPACTGAIQVPNGGSPIVLMHDGPTVGGYPKIAVIRSASLSRFAQLAPGDPVRFVLDES